MNPQRNPVAIDHLWHLNEGNCILVGAIAKAKTLLTLVNNHLLLDVGPASNHHDFLQSFQRCY